MTETKKETEKPNTLIQSKYEYDSFKEWLAESPSDLDPDVLLFWQNELTKWEKLLPPSLHDLSKS
tara:strand:+ start:1867 stop:2061 length:195 start_codon:yes stop_codon:yes gene_type:complete